MQAGKGDVGSWKNWVIGILVVVVLVMVFWKPGILLSPDFDKCEKIKSDMDVIVTSLGNTALLYFTTAGPDKVVVLKPGINPTDDVRAETGLLEVRKVLGIPYKDNPIDYTYDIESLINYNPRGEVTEGGVLINSYSKTERDELNRIMDVLRDVRVPTIGDYTKILPVIYQAMSNHLEAEGCILVYDDFSVSQAAAEVDAQLSNE